MLLCTPHLSFFFFNDTATTEIYTLSLHDALPISRRRLWPIRRHIRTMPLPCCIIASRPSYTALRRCFLRPCWVSRSEEHTSELQSRLHLVCRLLLEKKNKQILMYTPRRLMTATGC